MKNNELCPCASGKTYGECCGPILGGERKADTAVELMRARYSAYAVGNVEFLYASSGPEARSEFDEKTTRDWSTSAKWHGLEVLSTVRGGNDDEEGEVAFVARYSANGQQCEHREHSYFKRIDGEWRFIDGTIEKNPTYRREEPKVGRNDPCPCGSGKKYKKCCGKDK
ncbi:MAG: YchJ family protein [Kiritimatiellae bacterium]|nr:YchJ family protein [Kiritimatiellia bacterium]